MKQTIEEKIRQRMLQVFVHSYLYYALDTNIVSDAKYDKWAHELIELRDKYPEEFKKVRHHELFEDFTGSGFYLVAHATPNLIGKAEWLAGGK